MKDLEKALKEKLIENGASADWLDKHLEVVDYTDSKMYSITSNQFKTIWRIYYG